MTTRVADDVRSDIADVVIAAIDSGTGPGYFNVYTGTLPSDLDPTGDTLLAEFVLTDPSAAAAVVGVATLDFDPDLTDEVLATGTPGYYIGFNSDDVAKVAGDVTNNAGAGSLKFDSVTWVAGGTVNLLTGTATAPATD